MSAKVFTLWHYKYNKKIFEMARWVEILSRILIKNFKKQLCCFLTFLPVFCCFLLKIINFVITNNLEQENKNNKIYLKLWLKNLKSEI